MTKRFLKIAGTGLLGLTLSGFWMAPPASAQIDEDPEASPVIQSGDDFDWGWIGLFGLLGLGGLMRRNPNRAEYRETTTTTPRT